VPLPLRIRSYDVPIPLGDLSLQCVPPPFPGYDPPMGACHLWNTIFQYNPPPSWGIVQIDICCKSYGVVLGGGDPDPNVSPPPPAGSNPSFGLPFQGDPILLSATSPNQWPQAKLFEYSLTAGSCLYSGTVYKMCAW
jgi:hypothetical protein